MKFQNEDGLTFNCRPLNKCTFDISNKEMYVAVINLDNENYAVFNNNERLNCIRGARNFTVKYKLPIKVYAVNLDSDGNLRFTEQFKYTYEDYLRYLKRPKI